DDAKICVDKLSWLLINKILGCCNLGVFQMAPVPVNDRLGRYETALRQSDKEVRTKADTRHSKAQAWRSNTRARKE
ncbi:hypothetical protein WA026_007356, partial [Henosepilachna vigintioctopunctata]